MCVLRCVLVPVCWGFMKTALGGAKTPHSTLGAEKQRGWCQCDKRTAVQASIVTSWYYASTVGDGARTQMEGELGDSDASGFPPTWS